MLHLSAAGQAKYARMMPKPLTKAGAQDVWAAAKAEGLTGRALRKTPAVTTTSLVFDQGTSEWQLKKWLQQYAAGYFYAARALKFAKFAQLGGPHKIAVRRNILINAIQVFTDGTFGGRGSDGVECATGFPFVCMRV